MCLTLYKKEMKSNSKILFIFMAVIALYSSMIVAMYDPKLTSSLDMMAESMPQIFAAFNMTHVSTTLLDFITNYLYGFILIAFPFLFCVIITHRLLSRYIDKGSMAYLLSTHHSRRSIVFTQLIVLLTNIIILILWAFFLILILSMVMFDENIEIIDFMFVNIGLLGLHCFLASLCYFGGCVFNDTKYSIGFGAGLGVFFILVQMISQVGDKFEFLKYMTPMTLFQPQEIISGANEAYIGIIVLFVGSFLIFMVSQNIFCHRDLPL